MSKLRVPVSARDHISGGRNAIVTLVEYGDYECPHCGAAQPNVHRVQAQFGDRLAFVFRHFPLTEIHPHALDAAQTAEFAGDHGQFWAMHDAIFRNQRVLSQTTLFALATSLGLSHVDLRDAIQRGRYLDKINEDFMGGIRSGVNGTPTFFINGERYNGNYLAPSLITAINAEMHAAVGQS
ncbi:MAG: putative Membrane protein [Devosia sp.]|uniref:DsbA family protein n=1 Tax=Devosia sp. TaxID=1871048 RepID=UPI002610F0D6|nr:DsbA family protein [Devosia sp.]MDB5540307.1 putative Membrane protein [Devosia sp.]